MKLNPYQNNLLMLIQMPYGIATIILLFLSPNCVKFCCGSGLIPSQRGRLTAWLWQQCPWFAEMVMEPCGPQIRSWYLCSSKEGVPWHSQTGLPSPPVLFCSPAHKIISMLFRAGAGGSRGEAAEAQGVGQRLSKSAMATGDVFLREMIGPNKGCATVDLALPFREEGSLGGCFFASHWAGQGSMSWPLGLASPPGPPQECGGTAFLTGFFFFFALFFFCRFFPPQWCKLH